MFSLPPFTRILAAFALAMVFTQPAGADVNVKVKELMPLLKPVKASKKANPADFKSAQERMIRIIDFLERVDGKSGIDAKHILSNAFYIYDRDRFSGHRRMLTESTITQCWMKARELGLFDKRNGNQFGLTINNGREKNKKAKFEYIIPPGANASFSADLANIRLVSPSMKRKSTELSRAEVGYLEHLVWIEKEVLYGRPDELGRTVAENNGLWNAEVKKTGDAYKEKAPILRVGGKLTATPSSLSGNRWRVNFGASSLSRHPTQFTAEYYLFGVAESGDKSFLLHRGKKVIKLRSTQSYNFDIWSDEKVGAVNFRGWVIQIRHNGKVIATAASKLGIGKLIAYAGTLPRMGNTGSSSSSRKNRKK